MPIRPVNSVSLSYLHGTSPSMDSRTPSALARSFQPLLAKIYQAVCSSAEAGAYPVE